MEGTSLFTSHARCVCLCVCLPGIGMLLKDLS